MYGRAALGSIALVTGIGVYALAQETQPFPGPGTGIVKVAGTIDVGNTPIVLATQYEEWKVAISNMPDVRVVNTPSVSIAPPTFLRKGGRYEITWPTGERQTIQVVESAPGGWVRIDASRQRWINLASARAVDEAS